MTQKQNHFFSGAHGGHRAAMTFGIFAGVLCGALLVSKHFILPQFTTVTVEGQSYRATEVGTLHASLVAEVGVSETERNELILPVHDQSYLAVRDAKQVRRAESDGFLALEQFLRPYRHGDRPHVLLQRFAILAPGEGVLLKGDVRNVGEQSMTVLADIVEQMKKLPGVIGVETGGFERVVDPYMGSYSPFVITVRFQ